MNKILYFLIIVVIVFYLKTKKSGFTSSSLDQAVFIIYAPWCGHCKRSMPEFEKASSLDNKIVLVNSDDQSTKDIVDKFSVKSFPTIVKSDGTAYMGDRKADSIVEFANQ